MKNNNIKEKNKKIRIKNKMHYNWILKNQISKKNFKILKSLDFRDFNLSKFSRDI